MQSRLMSGPNLTSASILETATSHDYVTESRYGGWHRQANCRPSPVALYRARGIPLLNRALGGFPETFTSGFLLRSGHLKCSAPFRRTP
jgi:hypothetical protein